MEAIFLRFVRMSLAGSVVILAILLLRLPLHRAPRKYSYLLWSAAAFRLCIPVNLPSPLSLFRFLRRPATAVTAAAPDLLSPYLAAAMPGTAAPAGSAAAPAAAPGEILGGQVAAFPWLRVLAYFWLAGALALLLGSLLSAYRLRRRLRTAIREKEMLWRASGISSPFLLGLFRPRIYLPWDLAGNDLACALAHEQAHLRRGDQWWRLLGWLLLCLHWFNPLCWLAWVLAGRDMEQSCDEKVLADNRGTAEQYAESLLHTASRPRFPTHLAFGEQGVRSRVKNVMRFQPAGRWAKLGLALVCLLFFVVCVTDPKALAADNRELALNADGTVGGFRWGMSPEEAAEAWPGLRFEPGTSNGKSYSAVYARLESVSFLGYTADVVLTFPQYNLRNGDLFMDQNSSPVLGEIEIVIPGSVDLAEELEAVLGARETHQRDLSGQQAVVYVDGRPLPPYEEKELPEEYWYWHSGETGADLVGAEQLRPFLPAWWELTDAELTESLCYLYGWDARIWTLSSSQGTDTIFVIRGEGRVYARVLSELVNKAG